MRTRGSMVYDMLFVVSDIFYWVNEVVQLRIKARLTAVIVLSFLLGTTGCETQSKQQSTVTKTNPSAYFALNNASQMVTMAPFKIVEKDPNPVLKRGAENSWDGTDLLNPSVIQSHGKYYNYYSGYDGKTWRTGLAISKNGETWTKLNHPILQPSAGGWDSTYIAANGSAIEVNGKTYYYFQGESSSSITQIGLATSTDHVHFKELDTPVLRVGLPGSWDDTAVSDPYVIRYRNSFYMYFLGMSNLGVQRIGVAKSSDGVNWTQYQIPILNLGTNGSFDENGLGEPSVVYYPPYFYMLYTGRSYDEARDIGVAVSLDGVNWRKLSTKGMFPIRLPHTWDSAVITDTSLLLNDATGKLDIWYGGGDVKSPDQNLNGNVGYMVADINQNRDMSVFDASANWSRSLVPSPDVLSGSYPIEGNSSNKFVWIQEHANIVLLRSDSSRGIEVRGYLPFSMYKNAYPQLKQVEITVSINGHKIKRVNENQDAEVNIKIGRQDIDKNVSSGSFYHLSIDVNKQVNTRALGIGKDDRNLAMIVSYIGPEKNP